MSVLWLSISVMGCGNCGNRRQQRGDKFQVENCPTEESRFQPPVVADPWEGEIETPMIRGKQEPEPKPQLLLAPAKELPVCDLSKLTVAELRKKAQALKVKGARAMKKKDLLMALS